MPKCSDESQVLLLGAVQKKIIWVVVVKDLGFSTADMWPPLTLLSCLHIVLFPTLPEFAQVYPQTFFIGMSHSTILGSYENETF